MALANAKALIRPYVDEVAEVLRTQVAAPSPARSTARCRRSGSSATSTWSARSGRTCTNWNPEDERLYVDRLFYRHTAQEDHADRLIVVVDQSGSMVDAMVNCTILASIFAGLPQVDVHLIAFDTRRST